VIDPIETSLESSVFFRVLAGFAGDRVGNSRWFCSVTEQMSS